MHSSTASYIALQNLFKQQFLEDLARFKANLAETLATIGLAENAIPDEEVENFARNVTAVGIIKGSPLVERKRVGDLTKQTIRMSSCGCVHV
jgi:amyloid beta precursor protein binding protein 1